VRNITDSPKFIWYNYFCVMLFNSCVFMNLPNTGSSTRYEYCTLLHTSTLRSTQDQSQCKSNYHSWFATSLFPAH